MKRTVPIKFPDMLGYVIRKHAYTDNNAPRPSKYLLNSSTSAATIIVK